MDEYPNPYYNSKEDECNYMEFKLMRQERELNNFREMNNQNESFGREGTIE